MSDLNIGSTRINLPTQLDSGAAGGAAASKTANAGATILDSARLMASSGAKEKTATAGLPEPAAQGKPDTETMAKMMASLSVASANATGDVYAIMDLFQKMAQQMRGAARETRTSEMQSQVSALTSAAAEMRSAAQDRFDGALTQGIMQIGAGALQVGGGMMAARATAKSGSAEFGAVPDKLAAKGFDASAIQWNTGTKGVSDMITGGATIAKGDFDLKASMHDADRTKLEADAKVHESATQQANDTMQQMMDVIRDVRDKLSSIQQSQVETVRGIARNI